MSLISKIELSPIFFKNLNLLLESELKRFFYFKEKIHNVDRSVLQSVRCGNAHLNRNHVSICQLLRKDNLGFVQP